MVRNVVKDLLVVLLSAAPVVAQESPSPISMESGGPVVLFVGAEMGQPAMSGMENSWSSGYGIAGGVAAPWRTLFLGPVAIQGGLRLDLGIQHAGLDAEGFAGDVGSAGATYSGGALTTMSVFTSAEAGFWIRSIPIRPYLMLGIGYMSFRVGEFTTDGGSFDGPVLDDVPALQAALGLSYDFSHLGAYVEWASLESLGDDGYDAFRVGLRIR